MIDSSAIIRAIKSFSLKTTAAEVSYKAAKSEYRAVEEESDLRDMEKRQSGFLKKAAKSVSGVQAYQDRELGIKIKDACEKVYKCASNLMEAKREELNSRIENFGAIRLKYLHATIGKFLGYLGDMKKLNKKQEYEIFDSVGINQASVAKMVQIDMKSSEVLSGTVTAAALGAVAMMGTPALVTGAVTALATASTGTAISALSGAAASNAVLAWLGGGAIAAGGGGVVAGEAVLASLTGAATGGVAIVAAGLIATSHYAKKLTKAKDFQRETAIALAQMEEGWVIIDGISRRTDELQEITSELAKKSIEQLEYLEPLVVDFDESDFYHVKTFQKNGLLIKSMRELAETPLLNEKGETSAESERIVVNTRKILNTNL
jgi:hypothetical protein